MCCVSICIIVHSHTHSLIQRGYDNFSQRAARETGVPTRIRSAPCEDDFCICISLISTYVIKRLMVQPLLVRSTTLMKWRTII